MKDRNETTSAAVLMMAKIYKEANGYTSTQLAEKLHINYDTLRRWEHGERRLRPSTEKTVAAFLREQLFGIDIINFPQWMNPRKVDFLILFLAEELCDYLKRRANNISEGVGVRVTLTDLIEIFIRRDEGEGGK